MSEPLEYSAEEALHPLNRKTILMIVLGGIFAGLSQPFVWPGDPNAALWDNTGLTGLFCFGAIVPALLALRQVRARGAYLVGLLFCWIQLVVIFYWIVVAMHVFGKLPLTASLVGLALVGVATGGQVALAWWMTHRIWRRYSLPLWVVFPLALSGIEYFRNSVLYGGFPWGNLGNSLASVPVCLQAASLFGVYGLVFWIAMVNAVITEIIWWRKGFQIFPKWGCVTAVSLTSGLMVFGALQLSKEVVPEKEIKVALLQGNIEQGIKNKQRQHRHFILNKYQKLQKQAQKENVDLVVWPEASLPGSVGSQYTNYKIFGVPGVDPEMIDAPFSLVGAVLVEKEKNNSGTKKGSYHLFNSAVMLDSKLDVMGRFDKSHLVPFGEYVPWPFHKLVRKIVPNVGRFQPGYGQKPIKLQKGGSSFSVGATVCYEGVFPEISRTLANDGADLLVNMTNDAWYGYSSAPWQHLYMYRLRSVETGRPFVRATNTGITAWVDPHGYLHEPTALYEDAMVISRIPLSSGNTLFLLLGEWVAVPSLWIIGALFLWSFITLPQSSVLSRVVGGLFLSSPLWSVISYSVFHEGPRDENWIVQILLWVIWFVLLGVALLGPTAFAAKRLKRAGWMALSLAVMGLMVGQWAYGLLLFIATGLFIWSRKSHVE